MCRLGGDAGDCEAKREEEKGRVGRMHLMSIWLHPWRHRAMGH